MADTIEELRDALAGAEDEVKELRAALEDMERDRNKALSDAEDANHTASELEDEIDRLRADGGGVTVRDLAVAIERGDKREVYFCLSRIFEGNECAREAIEVARRSVAARQPILANSGAE